MHPQLTEALAVGNGLITRRALPHLHRAIDAALRRGDLTAVLPGIYARPPDAATVETRARAACLADPDAVVTGRAAAILGGWTHVRTPDEVNVASHRLRTQHPGFRFERRTIDPELTRRVDGVRITTRPLTTLDLALELGDHHLDDGLRRGVEPAKLRRALNLSAGRRGFGRLRPLVDAVRDRPWSKLERQAHELLRAADIDGWLANRAIYAGRDDRIGYGDLVFAEIRLVIELDGLTDHSSPGDKVRDARRDLKLARIGWEVIRMPGAWVTSTPEEFVAIVRDIITTRQVRQGLWT